MTRPVDIDALEEALDLLAQAADLIKTSGLADDPAFRAYNLCQLEGRDAGWMGGPFLIDAIRDARDAEADNDTGDRF